MTTSKASPPFSAAVRQVIPGRWRGRHFPQLAGSIASTFFAQSLFKQFSGAGLVPDAAVSTSYLLAVALGAGITVILATRFGFPVSTTHGLTGAMIGAGLLAVGSEVKFDVLGAKFILPLLVSPIIAIVTWRDLVWRLPFRAFEIRNYPCKPVCASVQRRPRARDLAPAWRRCIVNPMRGR